MEEHHIRQPLHIAIGVELLRIRSHLRRERFDRGHNFLSSNVMLRKWSERFEHRSQVDLSNFDVVRHGEQALDDTCHVIYCESSWPVAGLLAPEVRVNRSQYHIRDPNAVGSALAPCCLDKTVQAPF